MERDEILTYLKAMLHERFGIDPAVMSGSTTQEQLGIDSLLMVDMMLDLETGLGTYTNVTGYSQPVTVEHRIEDTALVGDAQLSGHIRNGFRINATPQGQLFAALAQIVDN